jgi:hypothetical protein
MASLCNFYDTLGSTGSNSSVDSDAASYLRPVTLSGVKTKEVFTSYMLIHFLIQTMYAFLILRTLFFMFTFAKKQIRQQQLYRIPREEKL